MRITFRLVLFLLVASLGASDCRLTAQTFETTYTLEPLSILANINTDGANPTGPLVLSGNSLYGTTAYGGSEGCGTVFTLRTDGTGFANLHTLQGRGNGVNAVWLMVDQTIYGTTASGTVFSLKINGSGYTILHSFSGNEAATGLVLSGNTLFGTTYLGSVFALRTDGGGFTNLHSFVSCDRKPTVRVIPSGDTLYGTTDSDVDASYGMVFALRTDGTGFTNLHSFNGTNDGAWPLVSLALSGSSLYGLTSNGGSSNSGTLFRLDTNGANFEILDRGYGGANSLLLSSTSLYGAIGGVLYNGNLFTISTDGTGRKDLYTFRGSSDGTGPLPLSVISGDTLYGAASDSGPEGAGTVFSIRTDGTGFSVLRSLGRGARFAWGNGDIKP